MNINDLEFINVCDQIDSADSATVHGGASASVGVGTSANDSGVSAYADASASGDITAAVTRTNTVLIRQNIPGSGVGYNAGYATAYGAAYGADRNGNFASATALSTSSI